MSLALIGGKIWDFLKQVPIWVWIVIVAFITLKWIEADNFKKGGDAKADEIKQKQAEVKAEVVKRSGEIITEEQTNATEAIAARDDGSHYPTADSLPDDLAGLGFRNPGRSGTS